MYFCYFILSFFEKGHGLSLEQPKDDLCQVWLKLAKWFWNRRWKSDRRIDRWKIGDQKLSALVSLQVRNRRSPLYRCEISKRGTAKLGSKPKMKWLLSVIPEKNSFWMEKQTERWMDRAKTVYSPPSSIKY